MARKMTKKQTEALGLLVIVGAVFVGIGKVFEMTGYLLPILAFIGAIGMYILFKYMKRQQRLEYLRNKYRNEELVQRIFNGYFWEGQSANQLVDSLGQPDAVDRKVLKTKTKEVWKYGHQGANRYALRITLDDGIVAGWDQKT